MTVLAKLYFKYRDMTYIHGTLSGLRPAIVALVAVAGVAIFKMAVIPAGLVQFNWMGLALLLAAFVVLRKWKTGPIYVMLGCGALGGVLYTALGTPV